MQTGNNQMISSVSTKVVIHVETYKNKEISGNIYYTFNHKSSHFDNVCQMVCLMKEMFDELSFPQSSVGFRSFFPKSKKCATTNGFCENIDAAENKEGRKCAAKFAVHVQFRQNATWQGTIQWIDQDKTQNFRSLLEMLLLMDEALTCAEEVSVLTPSSDKENQ